MVAPKACVSVFSCPGETKQLPGRNRCRAAYCPNLTRSHGRPAREFTRKVRVPHQTRALPRAAFDGPAWIVVAMLEIETHNLSKTFGDLVAVRDLELRIPKGTLFGFLGPNGSGKSTTVKMLTGILPPTCGEVFIGGRSVINSPIEVKKRIGVLPEDLALFESLTIWEHLLMAGPGYGLGHKETETRAEQLLVYLDLWQGRHTYVDGASSGMWKQCSLAMALILAETFAPRKSGCRTPGNYSDRDYSDPFQMLSPLALSQC